MPVMSQERPNNFKTLLYQWKIIFWGHCLGIEGSYANDKFALAQPEAIVGNWLVGARLAKRTFPTVRQPVTPQFASVGPTIVCYMGKRFIN